MIVEEYDLSYLLYQESRALEDGLTNYYVKSCMESADIEYLNEAMSEVIKKFANKVMQGIQAAYNKFKEKVTTITKEILLKSYKEEDIVKALADESIEKVKINNYRSYDISKLSGIEFKTLNYEAMTASLESVDIYLKTNHSDFFKDSKKSTYENMMDFIAPNKQAEYTATNQDMTNMFEFIMKGYNTITESIKKNINHINDSAKNINTLVNNIAGGQQTTTTQTQTTTQTTTNNGEAQKESARMDYNRFMEYYFNEADGDEDKGPSIAKDEPKSGDGTNANDQTKKIKDAIQVYLKANSGMLSAQMKISSEILNIYSKILMKYMSNWKAKAKDTSAESKPADQTANNGNIAQVSV